MTSRRDPRGVREASGLHQALGSIFLAPPGGFRAGQGPLLARVLESMLAHSGDIISQHSIEERIIPLGALLGALGKASGAPEGPKGGPSWGPSRPQDGPREGSRWKMRKCEKRTTLPRFWRILTPDLARDGRPEGVGRGGTRTRGARGEEQGGRGRVGAELGPP